MGSQIDETKKNDIKAIKVDKNVIDTNIDPFYKVIDKIIKLDVNSFDRRLHIVYELLDELSAGCASMTDNHCRVLWNKGRELGLEIDETCKACDFYLNCIQNPDNRTPDRLYYNITIFWEYLIKIRSRVVEIDKTLLSNYIKNIKNTEDELDVFKNIVKDWDKK